MNWSASGIAIRRQSRAGSSRRYGQRTRRPRRRTRSPRTRSIRPPRANRSRRCRESIRASPMGAGASGFGRNSIRTRRRMRTATRAGMSQATNKSSNNPLRTARLALAVGDLRRATEFVERARAMRINYQPLDDTPDKVEAAIRGNRKLQGLDKSTEAYARVCSRSLMDQADALLRWGEYDEAERLASRAAALRIVYGPFEQKPQELIQRIASARRQDRERRWRRWTAPGYASASAAGTESRIAATSGAIGPPSPRRHRRRSTGSGRDARASGRADAAARQRLRAGRRSAGTRA